MTRLTITLLAALVHIHLAGSSVDSPHQPLRSWPLNKALNPSGGTFIGFGFGLSAHPDTTIKALISNINRFDFMIINLPFQLIVVDSVG